MRTIADIVRLRLHLGRVDRKCDIRLMMQAVTGLEHRPRGKHVQRILIFVKADIARRERAVDAGKLIGRVALDIGRLALVPMRVVADDLDHRLVGLFFFVVVAEGDIILSAVTVKKAAPYFVFWQIDLFG